MKEKLLFRLEEFIEAPIEVVFDYLDDDEKIKYWNDYFIENIYEKGQKTNEVGERFTSVQQFEKKVVKVDIELLEYEAPHKIVMVGYSKEGQAYTRYYLGSEDNGTRLVMESSIIPSNLYHSIITTLFGRLGKFIYKDQVIKLKDYLEVRDWS
ncbi:SRPBCC family protein [Ornithinibacillus halotolerans]|uniref:Activator of Hsp90 ATPase homologue 1/2-like C-terminal domain-containing protein n=1 Tax=Ornithinibacillus halotolerans TaxID=1274357 RepID=A0A916W9E5_9BACI|nr:SRPBCC family protein [Ornithinibacillus halotolerans]GGA78968.1 hypothetical protein GCM10008025_23020 [Ornithinibacillus halotolerans]